MTQTPEDRIRAHYQASRKRWDWRRSSKSALFMMLARHWKRPIREIKQIVLPPRTWQSNMELPTQRKDNG